MTIELVTTANEDGSGAVTVLTPKFRQETGNSRQEQNPTLIHLDPPLCIKRTATAHAFTAQVDGNDSGTSLTLGINGWTEDDVDLN